MVMEVSREHPQVSGIVAEAFKLKQLATQALVSTPHEVEWATAVLGEIATWKAKAENLRVFFTKPLNEHLRRINDLFREVSAPLSEADNTLRIKLLAYRATEQQREREARAQSALTEKSEEVPGEHFTPTPPPVPSMPSVPTTVHTPFGSATARKVWDFEVAEFASVPDSYLVLNTSAIRQAIRDGVREIPGLRIFQREELAVTRQGGI